MGQEIGYGDYYVRQAQQIACAAQPQPQHLTRAGAAFQGAASAVYVGGTFPQGCIARTPGARTLPGRPARVPVLTSQAAVLAMRGLVMAGEWNCPLCGARFDPNQTGVLLKTGWTHIACGYHLRNTPEHYVDVRTLPEV